MWHERLFSREILRKRSLGIVTLFFGLLPCGFFTPPADAATATTTTLTVTPSSSIAAQQIATLTASVQAGGVPVTVGTVTFSDGKLYLGSVQVVRDASHGYAVGTATVKTALSHGAHSIVATFLPTAALSSSTSASQTVVVSGSGVTRLTLSSAAASGNTDLLTATLSAFGTDKPTGSVLFSNQTSSTALGTVVVDPATITMGSSTLLRSPSSGAFRVTAADLNGDGLPDLLVFSNPDARSVTLESQLGHGDGTFKPGVYVPYGEGGGGPLLVADFNGDGVPDLASASSNVNFIFQSPNYAMSVLLGAGDGTFPTAEVLLPPISGGNRSLGFVATGDFNGDGIPDLTVTDSTSSASPTLYIFPGKGDGTFGTPITSPAQVGVTSLVVQDFNHDGFADMAITVSNQNAVLILLGKGDGTFLPPTSYPAGTTPVIATTLQSRGNGIADLAIWNQGDSRLGVLLGNGDGTFLPQVTYPLSPTAIQFIAADVTGDGQQDIVVLNSPEMPEGSVSVFAGNGDGTYQQPALYDAGSVPKSFTAADFNRDGVPDIAVADYGDFTIGIISNTLQGNIPLTTTVYGNGAQQLVAKYSGDSNYSSSTSNSISVIGQGNPPKPTFTLAVNPASLTISAGHTGIATLTVTPQNGFNSVVQFSCSGLPANSTCSFSPSSVTPNNAAVSTSLTLATNVQVAANNVPENTLRGTFLSFALLLGFGSFAGIRFANKGAGLSSTTRSFWIWVLFTVSFALAAGASLGCGGSSGTGTHTPIGTSNVTVTAVESGSSGTSATSVLTVTITN